MVAITEQDVKAWHEAGHAVIARALGIPIESISIKSNPAVTKYGRVRSPEEGVWTTLAATTTVMIFTGREDLARYGADGDLEALDAFCRGFRTDLDRERALDEAEKGLPTLIRHNKAAIQIVAQELLKKREVSASDLGKLLRGVLCLKDKKCLWSRIRGWIKLRFGN